MLKIITEQGRHGSNKMHMLTFIFYSYRYTLKASMRIQTKHLGFTVVELVIVIVVIGILAGASVVAFSGIQERAKNTSTALEAAKMNKYLHLYINQHGSEQFKSIIPPPVGGAATTACLGTGYEDVVEGSAVGCYTNQVGQYVTSNSGLDNALGTIGDISASYPTITINPDPMDPPLRQSSPYLAYLPATTQHLVDGRPNVFGYIRYILDGADVDCVNRPMLVYEGTSGGNYLYTKANNAKNSSFSTFGGGYTTCDLYFHPDVV